MATLIDYFLAIKGIACLSERQTKDLIQVEDLIHLLQTRISIEDSYAQKLIELSKLKLKSDTMSDQDSLICTVYSNYKKEMSGLSASHKKMSEQLANVVHPLQLFVEENKKLFTSKKDVIDTLFKTFEQKRSEVNALSSNYISKCKFADDEEEYFLLKSPKSEDLPFPTMDVTMIMGPSDMTVEEFNGLLFQMQVQIPTQDVKSFLGTYKDCFNGQDAIAFLIKFRKWDEEGAEMFMNDLLSQSFIQSLNRTSKFANSNQYKWKKMYLDSIPAHAKARIEADLADLEYRKAVKAAEEMRISLELICVEFINQIESTIKYRISLLKTAFVNALDVEKLDVDFKDGLLTRIQIFLESLDADKELQVIVEQDRTGRQRIPPIIYRHYKSGAVDTVFGVDLIEVAAKFNKKVPSLINKTLDYISKYYSTEVSVKMPQIETWNEQNIYSPESRALATECRSGNVNAILFEKYYISAVIGMLKLYLLELPVSLCSFDIYEPLKLLYLSKSEDQGSMRLNSLRSLLATMASPHFHTLVTLSSYWSKLVQSSQATEQQLNDLAQTLGPIILRPETETKLTLHDKHPIRLAKDILLHFEDIFSTDILTPASSSEELLLPTNESSMEELIELEELSNFDGSRKTGVMSDVEDDALDQ